jgi:hypothetical protein
MTLIHEPEIEKAVLGCILAGARPSETGPLPPEAFTESRRHVWEAMCSLEADTTAITHLTLADRLTVRGKFKACGGAAGIMSFDNTLSNAETPSIAAYAGILRERMQRRAAWEVTERMQRALKDLAISPVTTASNAATQLQAVREERTLQRGGRHVYQMLDRWETNATGSGGAPHVPTLPWPHEAMAEDRGILRGRVNVVAGRSGNFKTGFVTDGIWHWADVLEKQGGVIGLEDGCSWFVERLTARNVPISYLDVGYARLHGHQQERLAEWCDRLHRVLEERVFTEDYGADEPDKATVLPTVARVLGTCTAMIAAGAEFVVIDHGLKIDWMTGTGIDRRDYAIGVGLQQFSRLAFVTGCAIVFLWHANRKNDEESFPTRDDLAESAYLDREARKIYFLWRQRARPGYQLVTTVKATKGKEGFTAALSLADAEYGLLSRTGGSVVDFEAEAAERRDREREERQAKAANAKRASLFGGAS